MKKLLSILMLLCLSFTNVIVVSATDSTAVIQYKNADGECVTVVDLLDGTLPTDRTQQKTYTAIFPEGATNFRIYVSTRKIGTHNKGRISIGNVALYYED